MRVLALAAVLAGCASSSPAQTADLSTPSGFLQAFQSAAANSDTGRLTALGLGVEPYRNNVIIGGEWHERVMATTPEDMESYGTYWILLWEDLGINDEGEEVGSNISCGLEVVDGEYRIESCIAAG